MTEARNVLRDVTPEAIAEVRGMIAAARFGALASLAPADGWPVATRVGLAVHEGMPLILISGLAAHTAALRADPRCSLLIGEVPDKGDPLAFARVTLTCLAVEIERNEAVRSAYLGAQPKAELYVDLPDFTFMRLEVQSASYNAGFGRAYAIGGDELRSAD
jgi:putative heme iron utilization protein